MRHIIGSTATALALLAGLSGAAGPAAAQHAHHRHGSAATAAGAAESQASPYAGMQERQITSLSDEQIADLKAGHGMGLSLPAELNGYPGPRHVLDLAEQLELTPDQRAGAAALFEAMRNEAVPAGERLIAREAALDRLFADRSARPDTVAAAVSAIAEAQATLRLTHLKYHIAMAEMLSAAQRARYAALRGYSEAAAAAPR
jgi:Spy/CpxP family protein refolding chaperone